MEQHIEPEADKGDPATEAAPEQRAGTSGDTDDAVGRPLAPTWEAEKKKSAGEQSRRPAAVGEVSARERLKRHRTEMAGRVRIPDMWGQERLLNDWVDCAVFDRPVAGLLTARDVLVAECAAARARRTVGPLRVHNSCS